jgi:hypothetical protein
MKNIEEKVRKQVKRVRIQNALLLSAYGMGAVTLAIMAPNATRLLKIVDPYVDKKINPSRRVQQATSRLVARDLLEWRLQGTTRSLRLTAKGEVFAERLTLEEKIQNKQKGKWDGRWRLVSFDIWERHRNKRDRLRWFLQKIGFQKIHASLWAYPYDCEELIVFMRTDLHVGRGVLYFVADAIEGEEKLRKYFKLRSN